VNAIRRSNVVAMFKEARERGVWGQVAKFRLSESDPWETADSCWGFIGNDCHWSFEKARDEAEAYWNPDNDDSEEGEPVRDVDGDIPGAAMGRS